jgi:hypothetical protein
MNRRNAAVLRLDILASLLLRVLFFLNACLQSLLRIDQILIGGR